MGKDTFALKFTNTTNTPQSIKLFNLGAVGDDVPVNSQSSSNTQLGIVNNGFAFGLAWDDVGLPTISLTLFPNEDLIATANGMAHECILTFADGSQVDIASLIVNGMDLPTILDILSQQIAIKLSVPSSAIIVSAKCYYISIAINSLYIDFTITYNTPPDVTNFLEKIRYPNGASNVTYVFPTSPTDFNNGTWVAGGNATPNGVEVTSPSGTSYSEIEESQNGSVLEIGYLDINTFGGVSNQVRQTQLLNCLKFEKTNANGNDSVFWRCPTIDAYQFQNTLRFVGLNKETDRYTLDGTTSFEYTIEALTTITLDFSYTKLPNIVLGNKYKVEKIVEKAKKRKKDLEKFQKYSKTKTLVADLVVKKKSTITL